MPVALGLGVTMWVITLIVMYASLCALVDYMLSGIHDMPVASLLTLVWFISVGANAYAVSLLQPFFVQYIAVAYSVFALIMFIHVFSERVWHDNTTVAMVEGYYDPSTPYTVTLTDNKGEDNE